jgi:hypothetical protein
MLRKLRNDPAPESLFAIRFVAEHTSSYGRHFIACDPMFTHCLAERSCRTHGSPNLPLLDDRT